jgi:hypothetical protein
VNEQYEFLQINIGIKKLLLLLLKVGIYDDGVDVDFYYSFVNFNEARPSLLLKVSTYIPLDKWDNVSNS